MTANYYVKTIKTLTQARDKSSSTSGYENLVTPQKLLRIVIESKEYETTTNSVLFQPDHREKSDNKTELEKKRLSIPHHREGIRKRPKVNQWYLDVNKQRDKGVIQRKQVEHCHASLYERRQEISAQRSREAEWDRAHNQEIKLQRQASSEYERQREASWKTARELEMIKVQRQGRHKYFTNRRAILRQREIAQKRAREREIKERKEANQKCLTRKREVECQREASRIAINSIKRTVFLDNVSVMKDFAELIGCTANQSHLLAI